MLTRSPAVRYFLQHIGAAGFRVKRAVCQETVRIGRVVFWRTHGSRPSPLQSPYGSCSDGTRLTTNWISRKGVKGKKKTASLNTFKQLQRLMTVMGENPRMGQQHCSYSTIKIYVTVKRRKTVENKIIPNLFATRDYSNTEKNVVKQLTFCPEYKVLSLEQIQYNTILSTALHIFKYSGGCILLWVCL